jgi:hypothetical protein
MGCPSSVVIEQTLTFTICTHAADRTEANADEPPTYRVYDGSGAGTLLLTGALDAIDPFDTVGFYGAAIECTTENGFVASRGYYVKVRAVVDGDPGSISYAFTVESDAKIDAIYEAIVGTGTFTKIYTVTVDGVPASDVVCRMTTDTAGLRCVSVGVSDDNGAVLFRHRLAPGTTVYIFPQKLGVKFDFAGNVYDTEVI